MGNKDYKVQAASTPDSRSLFIFKTCVAKNRSEGREGLFFTVNLVFSLNTAVYRMQEERLPIADGHDPTTSAVAATRNPQSIPLHSVSSFTALSCPMPCSSAPAGHCQQHWSLMPGTWGGRQAQGQAASLLFRSYWENATLPRGTFWLYDKGWV